MVKIEYCVRGDTQMKKIILSIFMILLFLPIGAFADNYVVIVNTSSVNVTLGNSVEAVYTLSTTEICNVNETNVANVVFNVGFANPFQFSGCNRYSVIFTPLATDVGENSVAINVTGGASDSYDVSGAKLTVYVDTIMPTVSPTPTLVPSIIAPDNIIAEATGNTTFVSLGEPIVTNTSEIPINNAPAGFFKGITNVFWSFLNLTITATQTVTIVDTTKPVITLIGDNPQIVTIGTPHVEYNAIVTDNYDSSLTPTIVSNVINSTLGSYNVTYDAIDSSGNSANQIIRSVVVAPVSLTIKAPDDIINITASGNKTFVALGNPAVTGNTTEAINNAPNGSLFNIGTTAVIWSVANSTATISASQSITIIDTTKPVINITSPTNRYYTPLQNVTVKFSCSDFGTTDCVGTVANGSKLDTNSETGVSGTTFTVNATDNSGNTASTQVTYYVAKAKVMITFDDGWASVNNTAYPIMKSNGQAGVAFVYPAVNDSLVIDVGSDFMTIAQLDALYMSGWDISSHTYNHVNLTTVNTTVLNSELSRSKAWLESQGYTRSSIFLAYPEGSFNSSVITAAKNNNYVAARTVNPPTDYARFNNLSGDAIFNLTSYETQGGTTTGIMVNNEIDNMLSKGGLLILTFHKIVTVLSTDPDNATTEFTTADFQTVSNYLKTKSDAGQLDVVTMSTYFNTPVLPPVPVTTNISAVNIRGNFWINWTFQKRLNTDVMIVLINGTEKQNGTQTFYNATGLKSHEIVNISVRGYNESTKTYSNWTNDTQTLANNPLEISGIDSVYSVIAGTNITLTTLSSDADNDTILFTTNATPTLGNINKSTGIFLLNTSAGDQGTYNWNITGNDSYGSIHTLNFTVLVESPIQTNPYLSYTSGNFWINWLFAPGMNTDELQIFINGTNVQYGNATSLNYSGLAPHTTMNISIIGLNRTSNTYSNWTNNTITLENDPVIIYDGVWAEYDVYTGDTLRVRPIVRNIENDTITFATNASLKESKVTLNETNGEFEINPKSGDQGTYHWYISASDKFGSTDVVHITIYISTKPNIDVGIWAQYNDLYAGDSLIIIPHITAPDNNTLTFTTNASVNSSNATINKTTGVFQLNTTNGDQGTYTWYIAAHDEYGFVIVSNFTISIITRPPQISCCNIGGGGGGGVDVYNPNEVFYERRDSFIRKNVVSNVAFDTNKMISNVTFHGLRNYGDVTVKVAILKGNPTSKYIDKAYNFFAINLYNIKQQEEKLFVSNITVMVHINKTNLSDNTMKAYRFDNDTWLPIVAEELPVDDEGNKCYNLISDGLSNFVIVLEPKNSTTIEPEEPKLSTMASIFPQIESSPSEMISKIQESLYREIINWIKKYMWWV